MNETTIASVACTIVFVLSIKMFELWDKARRDYKFKISELRAENAALGEDNRSLRQKISALEIEEW